MSEDPPSEEPSDAELVQRALAGESGAFDALVLESQDAVYKTCRYFLPHRQDAEDAFQDVYIQAFRKLELFDPPKGTFNVWVNGIARNMCRTIRKRQSKSKVQTIGGEEKDENSQSWIDQQMSPPASADAELQKEEQMDAVDECLDKLPRAEREIFDYRQNQQLSFAEIAAELQIPEGTARRRFHTALERLKSCVKRSLSAENFATHNT